MSQPYVFVDISLLQRVFEQKHKRIVRITKIIKRIQTKTVLNISINSVTMTHWPD